MKAYPINIFLSFLLSAVLVGLLFYFDRDTKSSYIHEESYWILTDHPKPSSGNRDSLDGNEVFWHEIVYSKSFARDLDKRGFTWTDSYYSPRIDLIGNGKEYGMPEGLWLRVSGYDFGLMGKEYRTLLESNLNIAKDALADEMSKNGISLDYQGMPIYKVASGPSWQTASFTIAIISALSIGPAVISTFVALRLQKMNSNKPA